MSTYRFPCTKEQAKAFVESRGLTVKRSAPSTWTITDKQGHEWSLHFLEVNDWAVYSVPHVDGDSKFRVQFSVCGDRVTANSAIVGGRTLRADRLLKRFNDVVSMAATLILFNYVKL